MSLNQSRSERNDSHFRKPGGGRSGNSSGGHQRNFTGGRGRGRGGGGGGGGGVTPTTTTTPLASNDGSFRKPNNAQSGQARGTHGLVNSSDSSTNSGARSVENGGHAQSTSHGVSNATVSAATVAQNSSPPIPKAFTSQSSSVTSVSTLPPTPTKGDGGKGFSLQFGSISPGLMNGMQIPARTSSAPPDVDEQKRDQVRHVASRPMPAIPLASTSKSEMPKKDVASAEQPGTQDTHLESKLKQDIQVTSASPLGHPGQAHNTPTLPVTGISMPMPMPMPLQFHHPTVSIQFGGPNPQSQGMPLQIPNPSQVPPQQALFQRHLIQTQGIMHQRPNMGFNTQPVPQPPHQLGNVGMNMASQFNQSQVGTFGNTRKTVKITHPETHEELKLDNRDVGSSVSRADHNGSPQTQISQPMLIHTPTRPMGVYPIPYGAPPLFPVPPSTQLHATIQVPSIKHPVTQSPPNMSFMNQSATNGSSVGKSGSSMHVASEVNLRYVHDVQNPVLSQSTLTPVTVKSVSSFPGQRVVASNAVAKFEPPKISNPTIEPGTDGKKLEANVDNSSVQSKIPPSIDVNLSHATSSDISGGSPRESGLCTTHGDDAKRETLIMPSSTRDIQSQFVKKGHSQSSHQVGQSSTSLVPVPGDVSKVDIGTEGSSSACERYETPILPKEVIKNPQARQEEPPLQEGNTKESNVLVEREKNEGLGRMQPVFSPNDVTVVTKTTQKYECNDKVSGVKEVSQVEVESATSCVKGDKVTTETSSSLEHEVSTMSDSSNSRDSKFPPVMKDGLISSKEYDASKSSTSAQKESYSDFLELNEEYDREAPEGTRPSSSQGTSKTKNNRGKKKLKEMLQKADAQGTISDLYMAYKGPEEKKASSFPSELTPDNIVKEASANCDSEKITGKSKDQQSKPEVDDWEDAADISSPKLESPVKGNCGDLLQGEEGVTTKYSRDFLLTFSDQYMELPEGFEITEISKALCVNSHTPRGGRGHSSPRGITDKPAGGSRLDRRGNGSFDADKWNKPGPYPLGGRDQGPNYGVPRNPRAQGPNQNAGGILSGPMHSMGFQGMPRNNSDVDRWQRATNFNKGLIPAPQIPLQTMHKAEKKYEVGKTNDDEEAKQKRVKGILNKLTPQNFEKLFEQVKEVNIDNAITLTGVINQIFDKALMEPTFCEMYADFCYHLSSDLPDLSVDNERITFKRLLLNKCQEEFERGEREEQEANMTEGEGENKLSEAEREEKRLKVRRRMLGNIRLIGELYKKKMLTERIMHSCIKKLLGTYQNPDEENIESLCKLMSTIGAMIDHYKAKEHIDVYFEMMWQYSNNMKLSSRVRFMLRDVIDLRKNNWQERRKVEGPKKIEEVHRDAAQERQVQAGRLSRGGTSMNASMRRGPPSEFGPRGPMLSSPASQGGSFRGMPSQARGYGMQDMRKDERNVFESHTPSVPLTQRLSSGEQITLGPQGGLAKGMAFRGPPSVSNSSADSSSSYGDPGKTIGGLNGYTNASKRGVYSSKEDHFAKNALERFGAPVSYDQSRNQEYPRHPDRNLDRSRPITPPIMRAGLSAVQTGSSEQVWPEERLREMSIAAIREYYSIKDEKEIVQCIKDLNAPSFYPKVVSIWVADSFEKKDMERNLLARLLVNLTKAGEGVFSPEQLSQGFEAVLSQLEDTVTDAPKAPEFMGRMFGTLIVENAIPVKEVGRLIREGGEEPDSLRVAGLAADILGSILEMIKTEKGDPGLNDIRSMLRLEDFLSPGPGRSRKLQMFM